MHLMSGFNYLQEHSLNTSMNLATLEWWQAVLAKWGRKCEFVGIDSLGTHTNFHGSLHVKSLLSHLFPQVSMAWMKNHIGQIVAQW